MTGGYSQTSRTLCSIPSRPDWGNKNNRRSSDSVWPLRRADGTKFYEKRS